MEQSALAKRFRAEVSFDRIENSGGIQRRIPVRKAKLLSTVAAALVLGVGAASAQGMGKDTPERAPAAQQSAPAEKVAPSMKEGAKAQHEQKAPETTGQAPKADTKADTSTSKSGASATEKSDATKKSDTSSGAAKSEQNAASPNSSTSKSSQTTTEQNRSGASTTTGQGAAAGQAKLTTEQRTKISTVIRQHKVEPAHLNVSVSIGTRIPANVHFYPLPAEVVTIYPEWRGFDYILVGDQIVIIDPHSHEIVFIIEA